MQVSLNTCLPACPCGNQTSFLPPVGAHSLFGPLTESQHVKFDVMPGCLGADLPFRDAPARAMLRACKPPDPRAGGRLGVPGTTCCRTRVRALDMRPWLYVWLMRIRVHALCKWHVSVPHMQVNCYQGSRA